MELHASFLSERQSSTATKKIRTHGAHTQLYKLLLYTINTLTAPGGWEERAGLISNTMHQHLRLPDASLTASRTSSRPLTRQQRNS